MIILKKWYKLDNVGTFYAFTSNAKIPKVFRYSALLKDYVDENILQEALDNTIRIFPNFNVNLKKGFYWYYLDEANKKNMVTKENLPICFKIYNNSDDFLYRVSYFNKKINLEVSHILSDGRGSVEFFKYLITNYISIKYNIKINYKTDNSELEKAEDSFTKYYKKTKTSKSTKKSTYLYKGRKLRNQTRYMECHLNLKEVLDLSHKYKTTLTSLLVSILIYSFKDELKVAEYNKYIKIDLPVDLRTYFKSSTISNFFGLTTISYKFNNNDKLEDIIKSVSKQFKENINKEKLSERANLMVSFEKNWFCRLAPLFLKNITLNIADKITENKSTTCLSNIGIIKLDKRIEEYVKSMSVITSTNGFQFTICSFKDDLCIGISSRFINNDIIKNFCRYFSNNDMKVSIDVSEVSK